MAGEVLGSASRDTLSGLGPPPLAAGDLLGLGHPGLRTGWSPPGPAAGGGIRPTPLPQAGRPVVVEAGPGPRREWIAGAEKALFSLWRVGPDSDRAGLRLDGPPVPWSRPEEAPTEGVVPGAVQLPAGGTPIVLLANHGTTGGYPTVAVVSRSDVDRLAQCPPGQEIRLVPGPGW
jgi:allophanate hydrolase subunit 2